jgi:hypothetical protein
MCSYWTNWQNAQLESVLLRPLYRVYCTDWPWTMSVGSAVYHDAAFNLMTPPIVSNSSHVLAVGDRGLDLLN